MYPYNQYSGWNNSSGDRFIAAPFLLGALTGGVAVAAFNPYRPRPVYTQPVYGPPPGMYYGGSGYGGFIPY